MASLLTGHGLIAPLDLARFALAYLVLAVVPGYALAALLRPRAGRVERLALAVPCAYAVTTVSGLATAWLHVPFDPRAYAALAVPVTLAGVYARSSRRRVPTGIAGILPACARPGHACSTQTRLDASVCRLEAGGPSGYDEGRPLDGPSGDDEGQPLGGPSGDDGGRPSGVLTLLRASKARHLTGEEGRWWLVPIGVALAQVGIMVGVYARYTVPPGSDVISHILWTNRIAAAHVFPIALLSGRLGGTDGGFYPPAFHALTALILAVAPLPTYRAVFYGVVVAAAFLPLGLYTYVRVATGSARIGALATIAALAFEPAPLFVTILSFYPFVVSLLFVPVMAVVLRDGLVHGDRRALALAGLLGVSLFYLHPTEFITVALLALAIVPGALHGAHAWLGATGRGLAVAAVWLAAAAPALRAVRNTMVTGARTEIHATGYFTQGPSAGSRLHAAVDAYMQWVYGRNLDYLLLIAVAIGTAWCLVRRRHLGLVAAQVVVAAAFVDSNSLNLFQRFYVLSFPWALRERLSATHYWVALPLAAIGIDIAARAVRRLPHAKGSLYGALVAAPAALFGVLLPLGLAVATQPRATVSPADFGALTWLARHTSASAIVVNDSGTRVTALDHTPDAGLWMPALGGARPLFWTIGDGPGTLADRLYLLRHIADDPLPPRAARFVGRYDVRYVYYGDAIRGDTRRVLNLTRLLADRRLRVAYPAAADCHESGAGERAPCPVAGSYVLALNAPRPVAGNIQTHRGSL